MHAERHRWPRGVALQRFLPLLASLVFKVLSNYFKYVSCNVDRLCLRLVYRLRESSATTHAQGVGVGSVSAWQEGIPSRTPVAIV